MPKAYVLLNTEIGAENQVLNEIRKIEGVEEAHSLWGIYGVIVNINAESLEKLKYILMNRIEKIDKVDSKVTIVANDTIQKSLQEQPLFEKPSI